MYWREGDMTEEYQLYATYFVRNILYLNVNIRNLHKSNGYHSIYKPLQAIEWEIEFLSLSLMKGFKVLNILTTLHIGWQLKRQDIFHLPTFAAGHLHIVKPDYVSRWQI